MMKMDKKTAPLLAEKKLTGKHFLSGILLTLFLCFAAFVDPGFLKSLEMKLLDWRFSFRGEKLHDSTVVIVTIDDKSLTKIGKWPWKRSVFADLVSVLTQSGAKVIGFDIYFQKDSQKPIDEDSRQFVSALQASRNVILPIYFNLNKMELSDIEGRISKKFTFPKVSEAAVLKEYTFIKGYELFSSFSELNEAAFGLGHINLLPDPDGIARKEILALEYGDQFFPSLGLRVMQKYFDTRGGVLELSGETGIRVGDTVIPVSPVPMGGALVWGMKSVNYRGEYRAFTYHSVVDVLDQRFPTGAFKDKIVLIGATAAGLYDFISIPYSNVFPGVERHANVIDNILHNDFITTPFGADFIIVGLCLLFGFIFTLGVPRLNIFPQIVALVTVTVLYVVVAQVLFSSASLWLNIIYPVLTLWIVSPVMHLVMYVKTKMEGTLVKEESFEAIKMLGLSFMQKGMLEMAYDNFAKLQVNDESKRLLYHLANELTRKRKNTLAIQIYKNLYENDPQFEDVADRLQDLGVSTVSTVRLRESDTVTFVETGQAPEEETILKPGQTLGRYEIMKVLGQGAMGVVYLGKDPTLDRELALKTFNFNEQVEESQLEQVKSDFLREARLAGKLNHPNIVTIFDAGEDWDLSFIAMEVLEGVELKDYCTRGDLLPVDKVIETMSTLANALDYAHKNGVIHRDIKPANIMISDKGVIKIADFGIALATGEAASTAGTPSYMAPEQISGKPVDGRADLYALGVMFFELLTGAKPFRAADFEKLLYKIINAPVPDVIQAGAKASPGVKAIIEKLMHKDRNKRFPTGEALADALKNLDTGDMVFQGEAAVDLSPDAEKDDKFDEDKTEVLDGTRTISFEE